MSIFVSPPSSLSAGQKSNETTGQNYRITVDTVILLGPTHTNSNTPRVDTVTLNGGVNGSPTNPVTSITINALAAGRFLSEKNEITFPGNKKVVVAAYAGPGATVIQIEPFTSTLSDGAVGNYYNLMRLYSVAQADMQNNANTLTSNNYTEGAAPIQTVSSRTYSLNLTGNYVKDDLLFDFLYTRSYTIGDACLVWGFYRADSGHGCKGLWTLQVAATGGAKREYQTATVNLVSTDNIKPLLPSDLVYVA